VQQANSGKRKQASGRATLNLLGDCATMLSTIMSAPAQRQGGANEPCEQRLQRCRKWCEMAGFEQFNQNIITSMLNYPLWIGL
jgi:hypothetical protein